MFEQVGGIRWPRAAVVVLELLVMVPARIRVGTDLNAAASMGRAFAARPQARLCTAAESLWRRAERAPPARNLA